MSWTAVLPRQFCLLFVFCKPKVLMSMCKRYQCSPVFSPSHISEEIEHPCLQLPRTLIPSPGPTERGPTPLCQDISLTPAILLVLLHAGVSAAEDSIEKVLAKKI